MKTVYLIRKNSRNGVSPDAPWLLSYRMSEIRMINSEGYPQPVYTCIWGNREKEAMAFTDQREARGIASAIGDCSIVKV